MTAYRSSSSPSSNDDDDGSGTGIALAEGGYEVHGLDYEGHGKSAGLQGLVTSFDDLVDDCSEYFTHVCGKT